MRCEVITRGLTQCRRNAIGVVEHRHHRKPGNPFGAPVACCHQHIQAFISPHALDVTRVWDPAAWEARE